MAESAGLQWVNQHFGHIEQLMGMCQTFDAPYSLTSGTWTDVANKSSANGAISGVNTASLRFESYLGMDKIIKTLILLVQITGVPNLEINDFWDDYPYLP